MRYGDGGYPQLKCIVISSFYFCLCFSDSCVSGFPVHSLINSERSRASELELVSFMTPAPNSSCFCFKSGDFLVGFDGPDHGLFCAPVTSFLRRHI